MHFILFSALLKLYALVKSGFMGFPSITKRNHNVNNFRELDSGQRIKYIKVKCAD